MLISHKHKFITIDIPKTGTRSLRETLKDLCTIDIIGSPQEIKFNQHGTASACSQSLKSIGLNFGDYFSFCVVRNPWDRYLSFFKYYKEKSEEYLKKDKDEVWDENRIAQGKNSVRLFDQKNDQQVLKSIIINNRKQSDYYLNDQNEIMVSHIAEFSNLEKEFYYFCKIINIDDAKLKHENKSITKISKNTYNQELIDLVAEKEEHVIKMNGYNI